MENTVIVVPTEKVSNIKESYSFIWSIPNWTKVRNYENLVNYQKIILEADPSSSQFQTKWKIGLRSSSHLRWSTEKGTQVYCKLLELKGSNSQQKLTAHVRISVLKPNNGFLVVTETTIQQVNLGDINELSCYPLTVKPRNYYSDLPLIHSDGSVKYSVKLSLALFESSLERFSEKSKLLMCKNLETLLNDVSSGDLNITTSDGVTISAHKNILKAQCPVFAAMFNSENSESSTNLVKVDDISEKTMKILLHYFYTGDLLPTWSDEDTIVEFTYAAGKYQMGQVLELLDDLLGVEVDVELTYRQVQLLSLTGKLYLENAEMRLLQQIKDKVGQVEASDEMFKLFGIEQGTLEKCSGKVENLLEEEGNSDSDKNEEVTNLRILDDALGNLESQQFKTRGLQALALVQKFSLKNAEKIILKRFVEEVSKVQNADELFAIFGHGK